MKSVRVVFPVLLLAISIVVNAQEDISQLPGKLFHDPRPEANRQPVKSVFQVMEELPFFSHPRGMNIQENYLFYNKEGNNGELIFAMEEFYKDEQGTVKPNMDEPPAISIILNKPEELMDANSVFYNGEWSGSNLPIMFTDTFPVNYTEMNGYEVGQTVDTRFKIQKYILNPRRTALFRPVTQEEYMRYFIGTLEKQMKEDSAHLIEMKSDLETMKNNPSLKNVLDDYQNIGEAMKNYFDFMKKKKKLYENKLAKLSSTEKNAPAYRSGHKDLALYMRDGKPVEEISGHLNDEPAEENEDLIFKIPVFTFNRKFFDAGSQKNTLRLIVFASPFPENNGYVTGLAQRLANEVFALVPYKELACKMY